MQTQRIALGLLQASPQPRPLITADVDKLAASINAIGLIQPITVRQVAGMYQGLAEKVLQIVAGHHRVAAVRALGWTDIDAVVLPEVNHLQAELIEIDENLIRSELTPAQRIQYTSRRAEIRQALNPEPSRDYSLESYDGEGGEQVEQFVPPVAKHGHAQPKAFAAETAALTGQSKQEINRQLAVGKAIGEDLQRVVGTSLDKGVELTALARLSEPERKDLIERAAAGEKVTARAPAPVPAPVVQPPVAAPVQPPAAPVPLTASQWAEALESAIVGLMDATGCDSLDAIIFGIKDAATDQAGRNLLQPLLNDFGGISVALEA